MKPSKLYIKDLLQNRFQFIHTLKSNYKGQYHLIDMGVGEDKTIPDNKITQRLVESLKFSQTHKYADNGLSLLKREFARYLKEHFYLKKDVSNIAITMGAKSALSILPFLLCSRNDTVIVTSPGYIVFANACSLLSLKIYEVKLLKENNFLPDLDSIPKSILRKTKVFQINYPNNPTGSVATIEFYKRLIELSNIYGFYIINDAAYLDLSFKTPVSLFTPNIKNEKLIELYTMSKSHNMTGYRIGFLLSSPTIARKFEKFKDNFESGQFLGIQYAAIEALSNYSISKELRIKYHNRAMKIYSILREYEFDVEEPKGTFFLYVKSMYSFSANEMSSILLSEYGIVTIPYNDAGEYLRFSLTYETNSEEEFYIDFEKRILEFTNKYKKRSF